MFDANSERYEKTTKDFRNLKLNKSKCQIKKDAITYIGHILSKEGLKPDPKRIEAIVNMLCPQSWD